MKDMIYQLWDGDMPQGERAGLAEMQAYADRICVEHLFAENAHYFPGLPAAYGRFRVIYDPMFEQLDKVMYADTDVWPVEGLCTNIFAEFTSDLGICTEPLQPEFRAAANTGICQRADEIWAKRMRVVYGIEVQRDVQGRVKIYNSGLQVWSAEGRRKARERFPDFADYREALRDLQLHSLYLSDQHYLHAMMFYAKLSIAELDNDWNRFVHFLRPGDAVSDQRTPTTKMVHIQLRSAGNWDRDKLWRIVNRPQEEWQL